MGGEDGLLVMRAILVPGGQGASQRRGVLELAGVVRLEYAEGGGLRLIVQWQFGLKSGPGLHNCNGIRTWFCEVRFSNNVPLPICFLLIERNIYAFD